MWKRMSSLGLPLGQPRQDCYKGSRLEKSCGNGSGFRLTVVESTVDLITSSVSISSDHQNEDGNGGYHKDIVS